MTSPHEVFTPRQFELLEEQDILVEDLVLIPGKKVHECCVQASAWASEYGELIFVNETDQNQTEFIYYIGFEREAKLILRYQGISIWNNISEDKLGKFLYP